MVWDGSLRKGGLEDDVQPGLEGVEKGAGGSCTLCWSNLPGVSDG